MMILLIKTLFSDLYKSFFADKDGFSARKMSAYWAIVFMASYVSIKHADKDNSVELVITWLAFGALCLSIVTVQQITEFRNGKKNEP